MILPATQQRLCADDEPLISAPLWRNIIGQGVFQLGLMYALVTHGDALFGVPAHSSVDGPSVHYTIVFNVFVLLQLFNQVQYAAKSYHSSLIHQMNSAFMLSHCDIRVVSHVLTLTLHTTQVNARKIYGEPDVLRGLGDNKLFVYILGGELALQVGGNAVQMLFVRPSPHCSSTNTFGWPGLKSCKRMYWHHAQALIVQFGGDAFGTRPLTPPQWAACVGFGALGLLVRRGLLLFGGSSQAQPTREVD